MRCDNVFGTVFGVQNEIKAKGWNTMSYGKSFPYANPFVHTQENVWPCSISTFPPLFNRFSFKRGIILLLFDSFSMWRYIYVLLVAFTVFWHCCSLNNTIFSYVIDGMAKRSTITSVHTSITMKAIKQSAPIRSLVNACNANKRIESR